MHLYGNNGCPSWLRYALVAVMVVRSEATVEIRVDVGVPWSTRCMTSVFGAGIRTVVTLASSLPVIGVGVPSRGGVASALITSPS